MEGFELFFLLNIHTKKMFCNLCKLNVVDFMWLYHAEKSGNSSPLHLTLIPFGFKARSVRPLH